MVLGARRGDRLDELADEIRDAGGTALTVATDITQRADVERLVSAAVDEYGRLDVFVGNAGIARIGPTADLDVDGWDAMIDVNLRGVLHGIAAALPVFRRQGHGDFVTVVSTAGLKIVPEMGVYAATKNAVRTLLEALRQESTDGIIRTTSISRDTSTPNWIRRSKTPKRVLRLARRWRVSACRPRRLPGRSRSPSSSLAMSRSATSRSARRSRAS